MLRVSESDARPTTTRVVSTRPRRRRSRPARSPSIVGPNACGKSTLLRALARLLKPRGRHRSCSTAQSISSLPSKAVARRARPAAAEPDRAGRRSPSPTSWPAAATRTRACCASGRREDEAAVAAAMAATGVARPRRPRRRRALRRPAPARVARDGARPGDRRSCCSTSRRRSSTSPTRSRCSTSAPTCTRRRAARSSPSCTTSTRPAATRTHLIAMRDGRDRRRGRARRRSSTPTLVEEVFGLRCRGDRPTRRRGTPLVVPA